MVNEATTAPLQPQPPLPMQLSSDSLYSRKGMDSLKAALLILIVKERLKQPTKSLSSSSSSTAERGSAADEFGARSKRPRLDSSKKDILVCDALDQFTGDVHLWTAHSKSNDDSGENTSLAESSSPQENCHRPFTSLITHGNNHKQWEMHLQHVLQIIWRQPIFGNNGGHGTNDRWRSLCQHVACQLELAAAATNTTASGTATGTTATAAASSSAGTTTATDHAETTSEKLSDSSAVVVTDWIRTQLTAFLLPATVVQAAFSHGTTGTATTTTTAAALSSWWCTIWHHILHSSPQAMSQLLVPLLLELILQYGGEGAVERKGAAAATAAAASASATATAVVAPASKSASTAAGTTTMATTATAPGSKQSATTAAQDASSATSSVSTAVAANHGHDDGNNDNGISYMMVGLDPLQLLSLLEQAMECAPRHVLAAADAMLMQPQQQQTFDAATTTTTGHGTLTQHRHTNVSLLPTCSTSWFCTQDLAHDMFLLHQSSSTRATTVSINNNTPSAMNAVADFFLLGHGLAALSERLASSGFGISSSTTASNSNPVDVPAMSLLPLPSCSFNNGPPPRPPTPTIQHIS